MVSRREPMSRENRAKQFMPFDALKGFREALAEKERILVPRRELSEEQKEKLNQELKSIKRNDVLTVEYYHQGEYVRITGMVSRIDANGMFLTVANKDIPCEDIANLFIQHNPAHKENEYIHRVPENL